MNHSSVSKAVFAVAIASLLTTGLSANTANAVATDEHSSMASNLHLAKAKTKLLWHQEFGGSSGTKPNSNVFNYDMGGGGWGNNEHQAYTNVNARYSGTGQLNINVNRVQYDLNDLYETCPIDTEGNACEFESSRINTKGKVNFKYGRLVARIKVPSGDGTWPAFWLLGSDISSNAWPNCGEIDIMEAKGSTPTTVYGTAHGPGYSGGDGIVDTKSLPSKLSAGYHTYQIDWLPNSIKWYIDGKLFHTVNPAIVGAHTYVFNKPMFMILNVAVGGWFAGDVDPSLNSAKMSIDYVRYYSLNGVGTVTGTKKALTAGKP